MKNSAATLLLLHLALALEPTLELKASGTIHKQLWWGSFSWRLPSWLPQWMKNLLGYTELIEFMEHDSCLVAVSGENRPHRATKWNSNVDEDGMVHLVGVTSRSTYRWDFLMPTTCTLMSDLPVNLRNNKRLQPLIEGPELGVVTADQGKGEKAAVLYMSRNLQPMPEKLEACEVLVAAYGVDQFTVSVKTEPGTSKFPTVIGRQFMSYWYSPSWFNKTQIKKIKVVWQNAEGKVPEGCLLPASDMEFVVYTNAVLFRFESAAADDRTQADETLLDDDKIENPRFLHQNAASGSRTLSPGIGPGFLDNDDGDHEEDDFVEDFGVESDE